MALAKYSIYILDHHVLHVKHGDLEYIYYIWQAPLKTTFISIFEGMGNGDDFECIFVGTDTDLVKKYDGRTQNK